MELLWLEDHGGVVFDIIDGVVGDIFGSISSDNVMDSTLDTSLNTIIGRDISTKDNSWKAGGEYVGGNNNNNNIRWRRSSRFVRRKSLGGVFSEESGKGKEKTLLFEGAGVVWSMGRQS